MATVWLSTKVSLCFVAAFLLLSESSLVKVPGNRGVAGVFMLIEGGRYTLNFTAATDACLSLNVTMATRAQMERAVQQGLETCKFGWIHERIAVVPRLKSDQNCGKGRTGLVPWSTTEDTKFAVYCFSASDLEETLQPTTTHPQTSLFFTQTSASTTALTAASLSPRPETTNTAEQTSATAAFTLLLGATRSAGIHPAPEPSIHLITSRPDPAPEPSIHLITSRPDPAPEPSIHLITSRPDPAPEPSSHLITSRPDPAPEPSSHLITSRPDPAPEPSIHLITSRPDPAPEPSSHLITSRPDPAAAGVHPQSAELSSAALPTGLVLGGVVLLTAAAAVWLHKRRSFGWSQRDDVETEMWRHTDNEMDLSSHSEAEEEEEALDRKSSSEAQLCVDTTSRPDPQSSFMVQHTPAPGWETLY